MARETPQRHTVRRLAERADYDRETVYRIIDEALICHVGIADGEQPFVIPTLHARDGDRLLFHGLKGGRLLKHIQAGREICVAITLVDGIVLARSAFHHSMGFRSAVLFGTGALIEDDTEKLAALRAFSEHIVPGRWDDVRAPNDKELRMTSVVALSIADASAKIRNNHPSDDDEDYALPIWAGHIPLELTASEPVDDPKLRSGLAAPAYTRGYRRGRG